VLSVVNYTNLIPSWRGTMTPPREVLDLVERFRNNRQAYQHSLYNETQLRREFLDPLFKALGWDIANDQGRSQLYQDVIHEDRVRIGGTLKAPDYAFRIGGQRKFVTVQGLLPRGG
jgi:predicted type IV restriction endonuclease